MGETNDIRMLSQLRLKTRKGRAFWNKRSRDNEFSIKFRTGTLVIDENYNPEEGQTYCDFQIYNDNGDQIYSSGGLTPSSGELYIELRALHEAVHRAYYRVEETMQGFAKELEGEETIGEESSEDEGAQSGSPPPRGDIPF